MADMRSTSPAAHGSARNEAGGKFVNTNVVLQKALQKIGAEDRGRLILRCDDLPFVSGAEEAFEQVFTGLLQLILHKKQDVPQLFLHISCTADADSLTIAGLRSYCIQFISNVNPCASWRQLHAPQINRIAANLQKNTGSLVVNQGNNSGCLFTVSVLGKSL